MAFEKGHKPYLKKEPPWAWAYAKIAPEEKKALHDCLATTFSGDDAPMLGNLLNRWARIPEGTRWLGVNVPETLAWKRAQPIFPYLLVSTCMLVINRAHAECHDDVEQAIAEAVKEMAVMMSFARP